MISSTSIASISAAQPRQHVLGAIYMGDLGSPTFDRVRAEGREATRAELDKIHDETKEITFAIHGFRKAGVADPLAAAREAVAKTRAQQFDSRRRRCRTPSCPSTRCFGRKAPCLRH